MWKHVLLLAVLLAVALTRPSAAEDFDHWLDGVKRDAEAAGVPQSTVDAALRDVAPVARVIELDQRQPETTLTFGEYLAHVVVSKRIAEGKSLAQRNAAILRRVKASYAIPPRIILALWAIESSYGHAMGDFRVVDSLATLAYDGRRPDLFRAELISALKILSRSRFQSADLKGSWAGAMGQTQFMPSTYLRYAVDLHNSGAPDIWHDTGDVLASAANYLSQLGWDADQGWGREVRLPAGFDSRLIGLSTRREVAEWARLGVRREGGGRLPASAIEASVVAPDGPDGRVFLVYDNFRTIMKWNHSTYFALAVCLLGDAIGVR